MLDIVALSATLMTRACTTGSRRAASTLTSTGSPTMNGVRSADGTAIAFSRTGTGEPLVLVHGTTADRSRWNRVLPQLESRFTVYAMDRRGRGESGDAADYALAREFEDVAAVVTSIGQPTNLLGHSHGAICALEGALRATNVKRLVLYEPPIYMGVPIYQPETVARLRQLLDAGDRQGVVRAFFTQVVRMPPHELGKLESLPSWPARVAAAHTVVRELEHNDDYRFDADDVRQLRVPTLLLLGGDSPPFFRMATERLAQTLPNSRLVALPGQQHIAMDTAPDLFLTEVLEFLAS